MTASKWAAAALLAGAACGGPETEEVVPTDLYAHCSRASGTICTIAGTGVAGDGADLLAPRKTRLYLPTDMAVSPAGELHVIDWNNHRIRAVGSDGRLRIVAGEGELAAHAHDVVGTRLNHPTDIVFDKQGRLVIAAWHNSRIKRRDPLTGMLEDIAGTGGRAFGGDGGPAATAVLDLPVGLVFDENENLYVSDQANERIRCIDPQGIIRTVAGTGTAGYGGDGGEPLAATFNLPRGQAGHPAGHIARDAQGALYLADTLNHRVRKIDLRAQLVTTIAGTGAPGTAGDGGPATAAQLNQPVDLAFSPRGELHIADTENNCIRKIDAAGVVSTVAGTCGPCVGAACSCPAFDDACVGDGGPARAARLRMPFGIAFDASGNLLVADSLDHRIRVVFE